MPRGILGSLAICTVLYVLVSGVMVGLVPYREMLNEPAPLVVAVQAAADRAAGTAWQGPMDIVKILVAVGALAGLSSVMVVNMLAQPRIFLAMSRDGLLPPWAGRVHPRFRTPHVSTIGTHADRYARQSGEHRHAAGVRHRVDRRDRAQAHAA
jgi:APA family basic amino acid/polyamine antiporter